ncbi:MAG: hypothetical protein JKY04_00325 [Sneathiella sp.]|nr:hypothetical protein [Sneathiella sp.]
MVGEINYNQLVEHALLNVVRDSIKHAVKHGLSGEQHFYVTFKTHHPNVSIPAHLKERYKDEMTIVLQHQYWDLIVEDDFFSLGLSFNHRRETLVIPFDAISAFADPSVQFGLQFNIESAEDFTSDKDADQSTSEEITDEDKPAAKKEHKAGEVIALDAFRNNK